MLRPLGKFERALYLSNIYSPFNIVSMLELESPPPPRNVEIALAVLQARHPFLRARLDTIDGNPCLVEMEGPSLPFAFIPCKGDRWERIVEEEFNRRLDSGTDPLFRCLYCYDDSRAELFLVIQHTIVDGASMANLLHEIMTLCANPLSSLPPLEPAPPVESRFPPSTRGSRGLIRILDYTRRQIGDEIYYQIASRRSRHPQVRLGGHMHVHSRTLNSALTNSLSYRSRREKVTLNSLIQAATLLAVNRLLYQGKRTLMRTFAFPDLRLYVTPPLKAENLGAYISMLRYTFAVAGDMSVWDLARDVNMTLEKSFKRGDKFSASLMSENMMKIILRAKSMRMGANGVSYGGQSDLESQYGSIKVRALHGFIANIDLGAELATQATLFSDELILDMTFLDTDFNHMEALGMGSEIQAILEKAVEEVP